EVEPEEAAVAEELLYRLAAEVELSRAVVLEDTAGRGLAHQLARRIRRLRLTEYMALSAAASTSAAERSPGSTTVTPTLAPPVAPAGQAAATAVASFSATRSACAAVAPGSSTANSSPPTRATVSV